jgi:hypothetical protein
VRLWLAVAVALAVSGGLFGALTVWTDHTTASNHDTSREFVQNAKSICDHAPRTAAGVEAASTQLEALDEPANVHRAVVRLRLHWRRVVGMLRSHVDRSSKAYRSELKQSRLSAHLLGVSDCMKIVPA